MDSRSSGYAYSVPHLRIQQTKYNICSIPVEQEVECNRYANEK